MSTGGAFLRAVSALIIGVFVFLALGYFFVARGVREVVYNPAPVLSALESHDAYERLYDDGIISQQFEGTFKRLVGGFTLDGQAEAALLKQIVPPSELKTATENSVNSIVAFLNGESNEVNAPIDLSPAIPRIKPAVFALLNERIDQADLMVVTSEAALRQTLQQLFRDVASGDIPNTIPSITGLPEDQVFRAYLQSIDSLAGSALSPKALSNLDQQEQAVAEALRSGNTQSALRLITRAIADDAMDGAIVELRKDLDSADRFDGINRIAESIGTRQETMERFRLVRTSLGLFTGLGGTVALAIVVIGILGIAAVFYPFPRHMLRWPGVTLVVCAISFLVVGWSISTFLGPWESLWCSFVEESSCNLAIDVGSELLLDAAGALTMPSIVAAVIGGSAIAGARFVPLNWPVGERTDGNDRLIN